MYWCCVFLSCAHCYPSIDYKNNNLALWPLNPFTQWQWWILGIRWHDFVWILKFPHAQASHLCLTGLREVRMPYSDMWQDCQITFPHIMLCQGELSVSRHHMIDGNVIQVDHVPSGPTNSAVITTMHPLPLWRQANGHGHSTATLGSEVTTR